MLAVRFYHYTNRCCLISVLEHISLVSNVQIVPVLYATRLRTNNVTIRSR